MMLLQGLLGLVLSILVAVLSERRLNRLQCRARRPMPCGQWLVGIAYLLMAVGASAQVLELLMGVLPGWPSVVLFAALALFLCLDPRQRIRLPLSCLDRRHEHGHPR